MRVTHELETTSSGNPAGKLAQTLNASGELWQRIVQIASEAIILWDESGTIFFWNKGAHDMFGYAPAEVIGQSLTLIMPARYHEAHHYGMEHIGVGRDGRTRVKTVELQGIRKNGEEFSIEMSPSKLTLQNETFFCGVIRDISE